MLIYCRSLRERVSWLVNFDQVIDLKSPIHPKAYSVGASTLHPRSKL